MWLSVTTFVGNRQHRWPHKGDMSHTENSDDSHSLQALWKRHYRTETEGIGL